MLIILFLVLHFNFLFVPCGRLSWLPDSFLLHVKYTLSYSCGDTLKNLHLKPSEWTALSLIYPHLYIICLHIWIGLKEGNIEKNCFSIVYYYNGARRDEQFLQVSWLYRALILLGLALYLPSASVSSVFMVLYIDNFFCFHPSLYLLVSWAWWDWPLIWLTNHRPSVLWRCWLGHVTHKILSEMTYNVSSGTLNPTIQYHSA